MDASFANIDTATHGRFDLGFDLTLLRDWSST